MEVLTALARKGDAGRKPLLVGKPFLHHCNNDIVYHAVADSKEGAIGEPHAGGCTARQKGCGKQAGGHQKIADQHDHLDTVLFLHHAANIVADNEQREEDRIRKACHVRRDREIVHDVGLHNTIGIGKTHDQTADNAAGKNEDSAVFHLISLRFPSVIRARVDCSQLSVGEALENVIEPLEFALPDAVAVRHVYLPFDLSDGVFDGLFIGISRSRGLIFLPLIIIFVPYKLTLVVFDLDDENSVSVYHHVAKSNRLSQGFADTL